MEEITVKIIEKLLNEGINTKDILVIISNDFVNNALENGAEFEVTESLEEFGKGNSDNDLYEGEDFETWGEFLLSVPGERKNIELPSGKVFSIIE